MRRAVLVLLLTACGSKKEAPPPTCDDVIGKANELYVASKEGKDLGTQEDVMRSMNIHHACATMTPKQKRCVMDATSIGATDACGIADHSEPPAKAKVTVTCEQLGAAWSDYMHNGNRKNKDWAGVAKDMQDDCERNAWSPEERACWAAIEGAADQQKCMDTYTHGSKPPPPDPDDALFEEDDDAE